MLQPQPLRRPDCSHACLGCSAIRLWSMLDAKLPNGGVLPDHVKSFIWQALLKSPDVLLYLSASVGEENR